MQQSNNIMDYDTVRLDDENNAVIIIDQTKLPGSIELIALKTAQEIWDAIYLLKVRGAPAIGVAAAYGIYVLAKGIETEDYQEFYQQLIAYKEYLDSSRPTAVNLSWALNRMQQMAECHAKETVPVIKEYLKQEAIEIQNEDIWICRKIGEYGLSLVKPGDGILTHCNAGQLATSKYGTATAPIYLGQERGYGLRVFADETRPLLQGARLTAFELQSSGVDVTLICDNMSATVMKNGWVNAVFVGCDRVAANGDTANKIGTSVVAAVAKYYGVPVYICAPTSTIDMNTLTGADIKIEQRPAEEVTKMWYQERMAPQDVKVFNPAFDVTDHELIAGIVTEYGIARAPYAESLQEIFFKKKGKQTKVKINEKQEGNDMPENSSCSSASSCSKESCDGCPSKAKGGNGIEKEPMNPFSNVKKVIGVVSGKGGVGKSFVTASLACAMNKAGYKTGIMDADITGPSIPKMFGVHGQVYGSEQGMVPMEAENGTKIMSINLLLDNEEDPVIWRGPVIAGVVKQFWNETVWGDIDYLFVDMPPGTGDVPLTVFQSLPVDGIVIVTSPQELVQMIVKKAYNMADMMHIPVLGVVENFSYLKCPDCGKEIKLFGESHIEDVAKDLKLPVFGRMPLDPAFAEKADAGKFFEMENQYLNTAVRALEALK